MADLKKENQEKDQQMDEMLDSLLANYSSAEPRPGLETRILANLGDAEKRQPAGRSWNFGWLWAGAAVTAAIVIAALMIGGHRHVPASIQTIIQTPQPAPRQPEVQHILPATTANTVRHGRKPSVVEPTQNTALALSQRPAIFPTPTPLSDQEQLLLRYFAGTPREEVVAQSHPDEPPVSAQDQTEAIPDLLHVPQRLSNTR
jgi:hypothetical protein